MGQFYEEILKDGQWETMSLGALLRATASNLGFLKACNVVNTLVGATLNGIVSIFAQPAPIKNKATSICNTALTLSPGRSQAHQPSPLVGGNVVGGSL